MRLNSPDHQLLQHRRKLDAAAVEHLGGSREQREAFGADRPIAWGEDPHRQLLEQREKNYLTNLEISHSDWILPNL